MSYEPELRKCLKRLAASDTRIKRKNARKFLRLLLAKIQRECNAEYPLLDKSGKVIKQPKSRTCPICDIPIKDYTVLARHMASKHGRSSNGVAGVAYITCWCEKRFYKANPGCFVKFGRHLAMLKDIKQHIAINTLKGI